MELGMKQNILDPQQYFYHIPHVTPNHQIVIILGYLDLV